MVKILTIIAMVSIGLAAGLVYLQPTSPTVDSQVRETEQPGPPAVPHEGEQSRSKEEMAEAEAADAVDEACNLENIEQELIALEGAVVPDAWQLSTTTYQVEAGTTVTAGDGLVGKPCSVGKTYQVHHPSESPSVVLQKALFRPPLWFSSMKAYVEHEQLEVSSLVSLPFASGPTGEDLYYVQPYDDERFILMKLSVSLAGVTHEFHNEAGLPICPCDYEVKLSRTRPIALQEWGMK